MSNTRPSKVYDTTMPSIVCVSSNPASCDRRPYPPQAAPDGGLLLRRVAWFNATRLHSAIGHLSPEEFEAIYYAQRHPKEPIAINR